MKRNRVLAQISAAELEGVRAVAHAETPARAMVAPLFPLSKEMPHFPAQPEAENAGRQIVVSAVMSAEGKVLRVLAYDACIAYNKCMQYTLRKIPSCVDVALRRRAKEQGRSLNEVAVEALARGAGVTGERDRQRDLSDVARTWRKDPAFDTALAAQDTIDEEMWR